MTETEGHIFPADPRKTYGLLEVVRGTSPMVDKGPENTVLSFPAVALWELILFLGVTLLVLLVSLLRDAPLEEIANPTLTTNPAKAPWYFIGLQELLEHMHPTLAGVVLPGIAVLFLVGLPYWDASPAGAGRWFTSPRGRRIALSGLAYGLVAFSAYVAADHLLSWRESLRGVVPGWVGEGVVPIGLMALLVALPVLALRGRADRRELALLLFSLLLTAAFVFTVVGFFWRGPGFELYWPWQMPGGYNPLDSL